MGAVAANSKNVSIFLYTVVNYADLTVFFIIIIIIIKHKTQLQNTFITQRD